MKEQTAVEWLIQQISENQPYGVYAIVSLQDPMFEQAKRMEKEQIRQSYKWGWINGDLKKAPSEGEDYYDDKYKKEGV